MILTCCVLCVRASGPRCSYSIREAGLRVNFNTMPACMHACMLKPLFDLPRLLSSKGSQRSRFPSKTKVWLTVRSTDLLRCKPDAPLHPCVQHAEGQQGLEFRVQGVCLYALCSTSLDTRAPLSSTPCRPPPELPHSSSASSYTHGHFSLTQQTASRDIRPNPYPHHHLAAANPPLTRTLSLPLAPNHSNLSSYSSDPHRLPAESPGTTVLELGWSREGRGAGEKHSAAESPSAGPENPTEKS